MFENRRDAGRQLGELLRDRGVEADIVLAIPRGGLPVGRKVADALEVPLDIVVARKIGAPHNPELAVGAVASDGSAWLDEERLAGMRLPEGYLEEQKEMEAENAREKEKTYRDEEPELEGRTVVVTDDGVATGATMIACLREARKAGAARVVMAVPVGPPKSVQRLEGEADEVYCLEQPANFHAVGQFYSDFEQVSDEEARGYLG